MNLDTLCAQCAHTIVRSNAPDGRLAKREKSKLENTITRSLGVLQEDGVYAFFLFLDYYKDKSESRGGQAIVEQTLALLRHTEVNVLPAQGQERTHFPALHTMTNNLDDLLLSRQLLEQALVYARYHAKALVAY